MPDGTTPLTRPTPRKRPTRPRAVTATPVELPAAPDGATVVATVLLNTLAQVQGNAYLIIGRGSKAEPIHQMRVGLRRLRTALRELAGLGLPFDPAWQAPLRETFAHLGTLRDDQAVAVAVRPLLETAGAPRCVWAPAPGLKPSRPVRDPAFQAVLAQIATVAHAVRQPPAPLEASLPPDDTRAELTQRLQRLHTQLLRDGRRFDTLPIEAQHRVRKRLKRLRYLSEFVQALWPNKAVRRYLAQLKPVQDLLGTHNDCFVAAEHFKRDAALHPASWFAAGYLQAHLAVTARAARKGLKSLEGVKPFWAAR